MARESRELIRNLPNEGCFVFPQLKDVLFSPFCFLGRKRTSKKRSAHSVPPRLHWPATGHVDETRRGTDVCQRFGGTDVRCVCVY